MSAPILQHVWGQSRAADRIWAQVSGLAPSKSGERLFVVLQAFIDDSRKGDWFALGGYIATAKAWAEFSKEWEELLAGGWGLRGKSRKPYFKMSQMAETPERMSRVPAFYRVIENNTIAAICCAVNLSDLQRVRERVFIPNIGIEWGYYANAYFFTFRCLMDMFHTNRHLYSKFLPLNEKIDFYFDLQSERKVILSIWDKYMEAREDNVRDFYGAMPRFEDDLEFLPLQAADFWAWWGRKFNSEDRLEEMKRLDFGQWKPLRKGYPLINIGYTEDELAENIKIILRDVAGDKKMICDVRFYINGERINIPLNDAFL